MKKTIALCMVLVALFISSLACQVTIGGVDVGEQLRGSGNVVQEERTVSGVTSVSVQNSGDLLIELGEEERLVIEAEDNLMENITSEVRNGKLILETRPALSLMPTKPIRYFLTVKSLEGLSTSSSGDISAPALSARSFSIDSSSSGDISLTALQADSLDVDMSSSGEVVIGGGSADRQTVGISSSGSYDARDMQSREASVRLSSSGSAYLLVSDQLDANLSSSGDVNYWGDPNVDESTSSSGKVSKQD